MTLFSPAFQIEMSQKGGSQTDVMDVSKCLQKRLSLSHPSRRWWLPLPPFSLYSWTNSPTWKSPSAQLLCHPSRIRVLFYVCMYTNANCQTRWRQTFYVTQQTKFYTTAKWYTKAFHHRPLHFSFNGSRLAVRKFLMKKEGKKWVDVDDELFKIKKPHRGWLCIHTSVPRYGYW